MSVSFLPWLGGAVLTWYLTGVGHCHVYALRANFLAEGTVRGPQVIRTVFEALWSWFCELGTIYGHISLA